MFNDFSIVENPIPSYTLSLEAIFNVYADISYRIYHKPYLKNSVVMIYTLNGNGHLNFENLQFNLSRKTLFVFKPEGPFDYHCNSDCWNFWWFQFNCDNCPISLNTIFNISVEPLILQLFQTALLMHKLDLYGESSTVLATIVQLLSSQIKNKTIMNADMEIVIKAEKYMRENLSDITISKICSFISVEERTLRNIFNRVVGVSPKQYLDQIRLSEAEYMLKMTSQSISYISQNLGFLNPFYFSRFFKKKYGVAPSEYRINKNL